MLEHSMPDHSMLDQARSNRTAQDSLSYAALASRTVLLPELGPLAQLQAGKTACSRTTFPPHSPVATRKVS